MYKTVILAPNQTNRIKKPDRHFRNRSETDLNSHMRIKHINCSISNHWKMVESAKNSVRKTGCPFDIQRSPN